MDEPSVKCEDETIDDVFNLIRPQIERYISSMLPRKFDEQSMEKFFGVARYAHDTESATQSLLVPIWNILDRGGKRWRPVLSVLVAQSLKDLNKYRDVESAVFLCAYLCELVHNGSLIIDDIEDDSKMRRGNPCLHLIYNTDIAINAGNAMYFIPFNAIKHLKQLGYSSDIINRIYELYGKELVKLHLGQSLDIWWHSGKKQPTVDEYLQMCAYKTGTLARLSAKISALIAGANEQQIESFGNFAEAIGVAFQIQDDILNISGDEFSKKISVKGEDIHEGKRTLMTIHCMENATPERARRLEQILLLHTNDPEIINEAIEILNETNSVEYASKVASDIVQRAWNEIESIFTEQSQARLRLKLLADYLIKRDL